MRKYVMALALVSIHEAGHAVVAMAFGWTVTSVTARHDGTGQTCERHLEAV